MGTTAICIPAKPHIFLHLLFKKSHYMILHFVQKINNAFSALDYFTPVCFNLFKASYRVCYDDQQTQVY